MKVIITGATGMVGKGVLLECLDSEYVERVLIVNRSSLGMQHPKLEEVLLSDFEQVATIKDSFDGYNACFFCMGVSSAGMNEEKYSKITFNTASAFADTLFEVNPNLVFNYVSGTGTNSSEKGRIMWARVKGRTENYILNKGFKDAYMFRPGAIIPENGIKSRTPLYNAAYVVIRPFFGLLKKSKNVTTTTKLGQAMINTVRFGFDNKHPENKEINEFAAKST